MKVMKMQNVLTDDVGFFFLPLIDYSQSADNWSGQLDPILRADTGLRAGEACVTSVKAVGAVSGNL